jgi:hypothetical protein
MDKLAELIGGKSSLADIIGDGSALKNALALTNQVHTMTMSDIKTSEGFTYIDNLQEMQYGNIHKTDVIEQLTDLIDEYLANDITPIQMELLKRSFKKMKRETFHTLTGKANFRTLYSNGSGKMNIFMVHFIEDPNHKDCVIWRCGIVKSNFVPAQRYVIITETDSDIFGTTSSQHIEYLPANITTAHLDTIMSLNAGIIDMIMRNPLMLTN